MMNRVVVLQVDQFPTDDIHCGLFGRDGRRDAAVTCVEDGPRRVEIDRGRSRHLGFKVAEDIFEFIEVRCQTVLVGALQGGLRAMCLERATGRSGKRGGRSKVGCRRAASRGRVLRVCDGVCEYVATASGVRGGRGGRCGLGVRLGFLKFILIEIMLVYDSPTACCTSLVAIYIQNGNIFGNHQTNMPKSEHTTHTTCTQHDTQLFFISDALYFM